MLSLPATEHAHHELLRPHIDALAALADEVSGEPPAVFAQRFEDAYAFAGTQLLPHIHQAEAVLYPQLERLMQNHHSMTPMRHEHLQIARLIEAMGRYRADVAAGHLGVAETTTLRRTLFRLFALLKVHLAEEEHYTKVLEHNLSPEEQSVLARAMEHAMSEPL
jgi:hypothetical protein